MTSSRVRLAVVAAVVAAFLAGASVLKQRAAHRAPELAQQIIPAGSSLIAAEAVSALPPEADPQAEVAQGPPTMLHLSPSRTNRSPFRGPLRPRIAWTFDAGDPIQTSPAFFEDGTAIIGTLGGKLMGVSAEGEKLFETNLEDRIYASPVIVGDGIYVGADGGRFFALTRKGSFRWRLSVDGDADTSPVPTGGLVVFAADKTVYGVHENGSVRWRSRGKRKLFSSPAVDAAGVVYLGSQDNRLYGIDPRGKIKLTIGLGADIDCTPAVDDDGTVVVGTDGGEVVALTPESSQIRWRTKVDGFVRGSITIARNHDVIAGVYGPSPRVVRLARDDGRQLWSFAVPGTGAPEFGVHGSPVEDAVGNLYFGAQDDAVYALTAAGRLIWKLATGGDVDAPVVLAADGVAMVASDDGKLYRIEEAAADAVP